MKTVIMKKVIMISTIHFLLLV